MSKLNEEQRKVFDIIVTAIQIIAVLFSVVISIIVIANPSVSTSELGEGKFKLMPVLTDSMKGSGSDNFSKGDMVIAVALPGKVTDLHVGQVVTYLGYANGENNQLVTHRIIGYNLDNITEEDAVLTSAGIVRTEYGDGYVTYISKKVSAQFQPDGTLNYCMVMDESLVRDANGNYKNNSNGISYENCVNSYYLRGDYQGENALKLEEFDNAEMLRQKAAGTEQIDLTNIKAIYKSHIKGVGTAINWLQEAKHFLLAIVLPLAILFIYNLILFIQMIMQAKVANEKERLAAEGIGPAVVDEEEIRKRAIAEYLASQQLKKEEDAKNTDISGADVDNTGDSEN